jgi:pyruvate carboxylase
MVTSVACSVGTRVVKGDKLVTLEAMKMYTTINAPCDGVIESIAAAVGDTVESKDLLATLRA